MSPEDYAEMQRKKKRIKELKAKIASWSWLTKYAPRKFTDLISDERSNRVVEMVKNVGQNRV